MHVIPSRKDRDRDHGRSADPAVEVKTFYVYLMTNRSRVVIYTGMTNSLERRIWFHRNNTAKSFTKANNVDRLVYYEQFNEARDAISREKEIKDWRRQKKIDLVQTLNPKWKDLGWEMFGQDSGEVTRRRARA